MGLEQNWGEVAQTKAHRQLWGQRKLWAAREEQSSVSSRGRAGSRPSYSGKGSHTGCLGPGNAVERGQGAGCQGCPGSSPLGASQAPSSRAPFPEAMYLSSPIS